MIHIGIIGLGAIGQRLIKQFEEHPDVTISAVCDRQQKLAEETAKSIEGAAAYKDHKQLLNEGNVEFVYVAVPPKFHHAIVMDALHAKKHVLCEKPLANSVEEAGEMLEAARVAGVVHAMNFPLNYGAAGAKFAELIRGGYVGNLRRLELSMRFPEWPRTWQQNDWIASREQGGFVLEVGVHFIQQALKLFGGISQIESRLELPTDSTKCETGIIATAKLADGTPVLIEGMSGIAGNEHIGFTAYGTAGVLALENWGTLRGGMTGETLEVIAADGTNTPSLINELVKAVRGEHAEIYDFEVGYEAQKVLDALRQS